MSHKKDSDQADLAAATKAEQADMAETTVLPEDYTLDPVNDGEQSGEGESLEEALAKAEATAEENWGKYLRIVAELDNVRKRAARDLEKALPSPSAAPATRHHDP